MDTTGVKEMLTYVAGSLVIHPEDVRVEVEESGNAITLQLSVAAEDMGRVIGRNGRIAKEIRTLIKAMGQRENKNISVVTLD